MQQMLCYNEDEAKAEWEQLVWKAKIMDEVFHDRRMHLEKEEHLEEKAELTKHERHANEARIPTQKHLKEEETERK